MTVLRPEDASFVPERMFKLSSRDGIEPNQAVHVVRTIGECPECGEPLDDVDVTDAAYVDRDVLWTDERDGDHEYVDRMGIRRVTRPSVVDRASAHECSNCGVRLRILVEEKALGRLGGESEYLPDDLAGSSQVFVLDGDGYVVINPQQVFISVV